MIFKDVLFWPKFKYLILLSAVVFITLIPATSNAQEDSKGKQSQILTPPNSNGPTEVAVDVGISEIFSINEREETYEVNAYMELSWFDERLAFDPDQFGSDRKIYQDDAALETLKTEVWAPSINFVDARGSRDRMSTALTIYYDGKVDYSERFTITIYQDFELEDFPFDEQFISFTIEPFIYLADEVIFVPFDDPIVDVWDNEEWDIQYEPLEVDSTGGEDGWSSATANIYIERKPRFYISSFILPLVLIVTLSWAVFWMDHRTNLAERLSVSFTSVLTVVAFDFLSSDSLPKLGYQTVLDRVLTISYIFLALTIIENVISATLVRRDNPPAAARLDQLSRWGFPLAYVATLVLMLFFTLSSG